LTASKGSSNKKAWQELIEEQKACIKEKELNNQNLLFPNWEGAYF